MTFVYFYIVTVMHHMSKRGNHHPCYFSIDYSKHIYQAVIMIHHRLMISEEKIKMKSITALRNIREKNETLHNEH